MLYHTSASQMKATFTLSNCSGVPLPMATGHSPIRRDLKNLFSFEVVWPYGFLGQLKNINPSNRSASLDNTSGEMAKYCLS